MNSIYLISVKWVVTPPHPPLIDAVLGFAGVWIRWTPDTWLISTVKPAHEVRELLRKHLSPEDSFILVSMTLGNMDGWAPKWIWDWITDQRTAAGSPMLLAPPTSKL